MAEKSGPPPTYNQQPYTDQAYPPPPVGYAQPGQGGYAQPGPGGYVQAPTTIVMQRTPLANPPPDHLAYAIFVTICCCWPIGIFAILKAIETRDASARGDLQSATTKSKEAKRFSNWALACGIILAIISTIITVIYVIVVVTATVSAANENSDY